MGPDQHDRRACTGSTVAACLESLLPHTGLQLTYTWQESGAGTVPRVTVTFAGEDVSALVSRHGELLLALEHWTTQAMALAPDQHDWISFDAAGFKAAREQAMRRTAKAAVAQVRATGDPYHFQPMSSRERRLLHLLLADSGLATASEGEAPRRHIVLRSL